MRSLLLAAVAAFGLSGAALAQTRMVVAAYGGSYEQVMREAVIPPFEREHNVRIDYLAGNSTDSLARLQAQRGRQEISVAVLDDGPMYQAIALGFCQPIREARVREEAYPIALLGAQGGEARAVGVGFVSTGFGYSRDVFRQRGLAPPTSWMDLARPEFRRRISIPAIDNTYGLHTLVMMARLNGGSEANIDPGFRVMREQVNPNVLAYESSPGKMSELFQSGEIWLAVWGSGRVKALRDSGFPVEFVNPREGGVVLMSAACPVEGGPQAELAQKFVAHMVSREMQGVFATRYGYGPTNRLTTLTPEQARDVIYGEEQVRGLVAVDWATINQNRTEWTRCWQREVER